MRADHQRSVDPLPRKYAPVRAVRSDRRVNHAQLPARPNRNAEVEGSLSQSSSSRLARLNSPSRQAATILTSAMPSIGWHRLASTVRPFTAGRECHSSHRGNAANFLLPPAKRVGRCDTRDRIRQKSVPRRAGARASISSAINFSGTTGQHRFRRNQTSFPSTTTAKRKMHFIDSGGRPLIGCAAFGLRIPRSGRNCAARRAVMRKSSAITHPSDQNCHKRPL
jgi:hypothetical protein